MDLTTASPTILTKHLLVFGRVQGVFFRVSMCREAERLHVTGWVRNRNDGSLEAMLQGNAASLAHLIDWARHGPLGAHVEHIEIADGHGQYKDFIPLSTI